MTNQSHFDVFSTPKNILKPVFFEQCFRLPFQPNYKHNEKITATENTSKRWVENVCEVHGNYSEKLHVFEIFQYVLRDQKIV